MLTERGIAIIKQRTQPVPQPEPKIEGSKASNQTLLPLLGERGMRGGDGQKEMAEVA